MGQLPSKLAVAKGNTIHVWAVAKSIAEVSDVDVQWVTFKFPICMCISGEFLKNHESNPARLPKAEIRSL